MRKFKISLEFEYCVFLLYIISSWHLYGVGVKISVFATLFTAA